jgi:hypothetical protein
MSDNETFWCRADVLETGESRDFPIIVIVSSIFQIDSYKILVLFFFLV